MDDHGYQECVIPRQVFVLRTGLWILALLAGILSCVAITGPKPGAGAGEMDQPFGQLAQENVERTVWSLAFSADGTYLASATLTGDVWLEELASGRSVRLAHGPWSSAQSLAFAPTSHVLAVVGHYPVVRLWDVDTENEPVTLAVEGRFAKSVAFSTDGVLLAVSECEGEGKTGRVVLWNWRLGRRLATLEGHQGVVNTLAFSVDGSRLASGGSQGDVKLWDLATHRGQTVLQAHPTGRTIQAVAFSPDGTLLMTAGLLDRDVRLWDAVTGVPRGTLPAAEDGVNALAFSSDGPMLAMARGDGLVALWDVAARRLLGVLRTRGAALQSTVFSADGHQLATGGKDGVIRIWDHLKMIRDSSSEGPLDVAP